MMNMDKRQRAMLQEMGVRIWQPMPTAPISPTGPAGPTNEAQTAISLGVIKSINPQVTALLTAPTRAQKQPLKTTPAATLTGDSASASVWRVGSLQTLYADTTRQNASRWLVLLEAPASSPSSSFNPLDGDAGKLLDNMLRAAQLHLAGAVLLAPLVRSGAGSDLPGALANVLASAQADVVLVMGRLAAQALLQSTEPLAKLRGQVHVVQGQQIVITIDPAYLLRNPLEKAKAWDDLCLATSVVSAAGRVSAHPK